MVLFLFYTNLCALDCVYQANGINYFVQGGLVELNIFKSSGWQLVMQTDWMSKFILLSLFFLSVYCIAVIIFKYLSLRQQRKLMQKFLEKFKRTRSLAELVQLCEEYPESLGAHLSLYIIHEAQRVSRQNMQSVVGFDQKQHDYLETVTGQQVSALILEQESYLPLLGSSAAVSPLVGLFGTIWGLIHAFIDISKEKSADIATVAPGIAEALITTLAGLVVAIPAMIAFYYFSHQLRRLESQLLDIGEIVLALAVQRIER